MRFSTTKDEEEVDFAPNDYFFRKRDTFFLIVGFFTYLLDMGLDMMTAYRHWKHENYVWSYLTILFVVLPAIVVNFISLCWYIMDELKVADATQKTKPSTWLIRAIFLILQMAPLLRYGECLYHGLKSRKAWTEGERIRQKELYMKMLYFDSDCILLRLYESFFEAVPQLILQLYILCLVRKSEYGSHWIYMLWFSCLTSLLNVAWSVAAYSRGSRYTHPKKKNISLIGTVMLVFGQMFIIGSRAVALVLFAIDFKLWVIVICSCHWLLMLVWIAVRRPFFHIGHVIYEMFLCVLMAGVYVFTFINDKDEPTRKKYIFFYFICGCENLFMMSLLLYSVYPITPYYYAGVSVQCLLFLGGLFLMLLYYKCCHPSVYKKSQFSVPSCPSNTIAVPSPEHSECTPEGEISLDEKNTQIAENCEALN